MWYTCSLWQAYCLYVILDSQFNFDITGNYNIIVSFVKHKIVHFHESYLVIDIGTFLNFQ